MNHIILAGRQYPNSVCRRYNGKVRMGKSTMAIKIGEYMLKEMKKKKRQRQ